MRPASPPDASRSRFAPARSSGSSPRRPRACWDSNPRCRSSPASVDAWASFNGAGMTAKGDAIDVGGAAGGFGVYWDEPIRVAGSFATIAPLPGLYSVGGAMAATGRAIDWFRTEIVARRRLDGGAHRGGGGHAARRRRRALPAVSRRRTLADLGPDGAGRVRRPDARSRAGAPRAGDPRGVGAGHPPRRRADPRRRDPGRRNAGLWRSRSQRDLEPDQGRRHRVHRRGAVGAGDRGRRGGDSRGHGDRRVSRCAGGDPRHDPGRPSPGAESRTTAPSTTRRSMPTSGCIRQSRRSSRGSAARPAVTVR